MDELEEMVQFTFRKELFFIPVIVGRSRGMVEIHGAIQRKQVYFLLS